jgi:hypothetical protein
MFIQLLPPYMGSYSITIDDKNRITIPRVLRITMEARRKIHALALEDRVGTEVRSSADGRVVGYIAKGNIVPIMYHIYWKSEEDKVHLCSDYDLINHPSAIWNVASYHQPTHRAYLNGSQEKPLWWIPGQHVKIEGKNDYIEVHP